MRQFFQKTIKELPKSYRKLTQSSGHELSGALSTEAARCQALRGTEKSKYSEVRRDNCHLKGAKPQRSERFKRVSNLSL